MTSIKCPQCGFVSSRTNANCKRCGAVVAAPVSSAPPKIGPGASKILIIGAVAATLLPIIVVGLVVSSKLLPLARRNPTSSQLVAILQSSEALKRPINVTVVSELAGTFTRGDLSEDRFLQNYPEVNVLKQLDLATVTSFKVDKPAQECRRYDWNYSLPVRGANAPGYYGDRFARMYREDGLMEDCIDVWNYSIGVAVVDPDSIDRTALDTKLQYLSTVISPTPAALPVSDYAAMMSPARNGKFDFKQIPIGMIEIVAVSDIAPGATPDTYTIGFKYRFNPNAMGDVFELAIHRSELAALRKLIAEPMSDDRIRSLVQAGDSEGLGTGYAEFVREESSGVWNITATYFTPRPGSKYSFQPL